MIGHLRDYPGVFDSEQIRLMSKALDHAWAAVQAGKTCCAMGAEPVRTALAKSIVAAAREGELDPHRLSVGAQAALAAAREPV